MVLDSGLAATLAPKDVHSTTRHLVYEVGKLSTCRASLVRICHCLFPFLLALDFATHATRPPNRRAQMSGGTFSKYYCPLQGSFLALTAAPLPQGVLLVRPAIFGLSVEDFRDHCKYGMVILNESPSAPMFCMSMEFGESPEQPGKTSARNVTISVATWESCFLATQPSLCTDAATTSWTPEAEGISHGSAFPPAQFGGSNRGISADATPSPMLTNLSGSSHTPDLLQVVRPTTGISRNHDIIDGAVPNPWQEQTPAMLHGLYGISTSSSAHQAHLSLPPLIPQRSPTSMQNVFPFVPPQISWSPVAQPYLPQPDCTSESRRASTSTYTGATNVQSLASMHELSGDYDTNRHPPEPVHLQDPFLYVSHGSGQDPRHRLAPRTTGPVQNIAAGCHRVHPYGRPELPTERFLVDRSPGQGA